MSIAPQVKIALRIPVLVLVLAQIAIPVELRPWSCAALTLSIQASDVVANIIGFVPVGVVLGEVGMLWAVSAAALISTLAETSQFVMAHRDPSPVDIAGNVIGAVLGTIISTHWRIRSPKCRINTLTTLVAATLTLVLLFAVWTSRGDALNSRGLTSPGTVEAYWKLDESRAGVAFDSSGHGLNGRFSNEPKRVPGILGSAVKFDGANDYIEFGPSSAFRLVGSMTISAWIKPTSFPVDDAAIVSQFQNDYGYQLDVTPDRGPRTVGFKLTNASGHLLARYGATPLVVGTWYHVAGVYDARARTLDVYLNGKLDDGSLVGPVTTTQHSSRSALFVGRRSDRKGFEFAGYIDDVRIYSFALTNTEIAADMSGRGIDGQSLQPATTGRGNNRGSVGQGRDSDALCAVLSDPEDAKIPGLAAVFGALVAVAFYGLWPSAGLLVCLGMSFAAGLLLVPAMAPTLPSFTRWMMPLVSLAGAASVAVSVRGQSDPDH
jgi:hypothetical protein